MDSPPPASWTYAARAAHFGDRVCPFCDHHNPAGAKFCNDCCSPLYLKRCNQCDAVNHQAATSCYKCGAECPALFTTPEATPVLPADVTTPAWATPGDMGVAATVTQPLFAAGALGAGWRLAGIATILIACAYAAYRINAATPDAMGVASQPIDTGEHNAPTGASVVPMAVEWKRVELETTAALQAPIASTNLESPKRATTRQPATPVPATKRTSTQQRLVPVPATKRASAHQRPMPEARVPVGATPPVAQTRASAPVGVAEAHKAPQPDRWEAMHVSLASCGGDPIARIVCDQRVRRHFCEGHWGNAPQCASGVVNDHGQ